jgi:hypothetical protein
VEAAVFAVSALDVLPQATTSIARTAAFALQYRTDMPTSQAGVHDDVVPLDAFNAFSDLRHTVVHSRFVPRSSPPLGFLAVAAISLLVACGGSDSASVDSVPPTVVPTTIATTTTMATTSTTTTEAPELSGTPAFDASSSVSTVGIDRITFGMTLSQAAATLETELVEVGTVVNRDCYQVRPAGGPAGIELTVTAGTIERVDISNDIITTRSGAGVGKPEQLLFDLFGERVTSEPRSGGGNTVTFTPADAGDAAFRVIFETDGTTITSFRSGRLAQVTPLTPCG